MHRFIQSKLRRWQCDSILSGDSEMRSYNLLYSADCGTGHCENPGLITSYCKARCSSDADCKSTPNYPYCFHAGDLDSTCEVSSSFSSNVWSYPTDCPTACGRSQTTQTQICSGAIGSCSGTPASRTCDATEACAPAGCGSAYNVYNPSLNSSSPGLCDEGSTSGAVTPYSYNLSQWYWECVSDAGNTALCFAPRTSGTLTASSCVIPRGGSTCPTTLNWKIETAIDYTSSAITNEGVSGGIPLSLQHIATNQNSGSGTATKNIPLPTDPFLGTTSMQYPGNTFYLYDNDNKLATATATASCDTGSIWDGTKCAINTYTVSATILSGDDGKVHGVISSTTPIPPPNSVAYGSTVNFKFIPDDGYSLYSVTTDNCNGSLSVSTNTYTTGAITQNCIVSASFAVPTGNVVGGWTDWTPSCPTACGSATITQTRTCTNPDPVPANVANNCSGPTSQLCSAPVCGSTTVDIKGNGANPLTIVEGYTNPIDVTWTDPSSGDTACSSPQFNTGNSVTGNVILNPNPNSTTSYKITCIPSGDNGALKVNVISKPGFIEK